MVMCEVCGESVVASLPTPLSKPLLLSEPIDGQSNHRLTKIGRDLGEDLGIVEVSHSLAAHMGVSIQSEIELRVTLSQLT